MNYFQCVFFPTVVGCFGNSSRPNIAEDREMEVYSGFTEAGVSEQLTVDGWWLAGSKEQGSGVEGAFDREPTALKHVGVDHGGADILVPEELLNGTYIVSVLEKMGSETMAKGMRADRLIHTGPTSRLSNGLLNIAGMNVMSQFFTRARLAGVCRRQGISTATAIPDMRLGISAPGPLRAWILREVVLSYHSHKFF